MSMIAMIFFEQKADGGVVHVIQPFSFTNVHVRGDLSRRDEIRYVQYSRCDARG